MKVMFWLCAVTVAALLSGGCASTVPAPTTTATPELLPMAEVPPPVVAPPPAVVSPDTTPAIPAPLANENVLVTTGAAPVAAPPTPALVAEREPAVAPAPTAAAVKPKAPTVTPPKVVTYAATPGKVTFNHQQHAGSNACSACHATGKPPGKVVLGKDKAHQLCKGCHQQKGAPAPTACGGCHKKG